MLRSLVSAVICLAANTAVAQTASPPDWSQALRVHPISRPGHTTTQLALPPLRHGLPHRPPLHHAAVIHHPPPPARKPPPRPTPRPAPRPVVVARVHRPEPKPAPPVVVPPPAPPAPPPEVPHGTVTGLPLPRFASLRSDDINLRSGPGARYPIDWVYKRRELPVMIEREFDVWRLIEMPDGTKGWVHQATLTGRRTFVVTGADATLRASASPQADAVAILRVGVVGRIRACDAASDWCQVQAADERGWLPRSAFWGTAGEEAVAAP